MRDGGTRYMEVLAEGPTAGSPVTQRDQPEVQWSGCQRGHRSPNDSSPALSLSLGSRVRPDWGLVVKWGGAQAGAPAGHWTEVSQGGSTALRGEGGGGRRHRGGAQARKHPQCPEWESEGSVIPRWSPSPALPLSCTGGCPHRDAQTARTG